MAKTRNLFGLLLFIALCIGSLLVSGVLRGSSRASLFSANSSMIRQQLMSIASSELGVTERSGRNDGQRISEYLAYCGLNEGHEWCAAFVSWCFGQVGQTQPRTPWSPALFPQSRRVNHQISSPQPGDVFGLWIPGKRRIGHAGLVESWEESWCITIEGNVDNAVVRKRRLTSSVYVVAHWLDGRGMERREL